MATTLTKAVVKNLEKLAEANPGTVAMAANLARWQR